MSISTTVQDFLSDRSYEIGHTVQFGWFVFRVVERGRPPRLETLDFQRMASFTEDFSQVERIYALQMETLTRFRALECPCTLQQSALVSLSYSPGCARTFLERRPPTDSNDSGWYIGVQGEMRNMENIDSFARRSLYEITIHDMRLAPFWLLPQGTFISLDDDGQPRR